MFLLKGRKQLSFIVEKENHQKYKNHPKVQDCYSSQR